MLKKKIKVAIIGTGNIGSDLCARMLRIPNFEVVALVGRRADSPGLELFKNVGEVISIFDTDGNGTLEEEEIKVTSLCSYNHEGAAPC